MKTLLSTLNLFGLFAAISMPAICSSYHTKTDDSYTLALSGGLYHEGAGQSDYSAGVMWKLGYSDVASDWNNFKQKYSSFKITGSSKTHTWDGTKEKLTYENYLNAVPQYESGDVIVLDWNRQSVSSGLASQYTAVQVVPFYDNKYFYLDVQLILESYFSYDGVWGSFELSEIKFS